MTQEIKELVAWNYGFEFTNQEQMQDFIHVGLTTIKRLVHKETASIQDAGIYQFVLTLNKIDP